MEFRKEGVARFALKDPKAQELKSLLADGGRKKIQLKGLAGSRDSFFIFSSRLVLDQPFLVVCNDKEDAAYMLNDLEQWSDGQNVHLFPDSFRRPLYFEEQDKFQVQQRIEALHAVCRRSRQILVTYPEAIFEKMISNQDIERARMVFVKGGTLILDEIIETLAQQGFTRVDFVYEPGQFSVRGGILDIFSFAEDQPFRIELNDQNIESIRNFDTQSQLSVKSVERFTLIPSIHTDSGHNALFRLLDVIPPDTLVWIKDPTHTYERLNQCYSQALRFADKMVHYDRDRWVKLIAERSYITPDTWTDGLESFSSVFFDQPPPSGEELKHIEFNCQPQPSFNKNFKLLIEDLQKLNEKKYHVALTTNNSAQIERFYNIFEDLNAQIEFYPEVLTIREGFIDHRLKLVIYTDHQIFSRFHGYKLKQGFSRDQALSLKVLRELQPGDFVTHMDYGVGRFAGLEKLQVGGKLQEAVRLIYKNNDILYVSIHSLHKISKFVGQEGTEPALSKLGSESWKNLKQKTKQRVKDIAKELIQLYAKRKASVGFEFSPDNYLQAELEASFMYEDTPDQFKATQDVKNDMEKPYPMDRLICGDVGFGKTEVALRAAFKAIQDGKQVAFLVPTTILALQHYRTSKERFKDFGVTVDYLSRFRTEKEKREIVKRLEDGSLEMLIGTNSLLNSKVRFKDLGLLIIDEEQKFGVAAKEKLRALRHNVDTLILTATPIPRTLQFSLMSARDLSIIQTPPPNRQPIHTERRVFNDQLIKESILHEIYRGGQVFFVHNKVKNLDEIAGMIQRLCPNVDVAVAHGQMKADKLEKILIDFIEHKSDVLVCTNIIETGLDIPNANTIIINNAHQFGLSDLHQLRGRVGRSNRKAYCYLFAPPSSTLTMEARKRLKTIEEFSDLGSGFNVAMRDLDIRGAGNLLGAEQSGFISDMGYETYQRILEEAIWELKESDFRDVFDEHANDSRTYVRDVSLETDIEMLIPDDYVASVQERLTLYQQLDRLESEDQIKEFSAQLADRFGPVPEAVSELFNGLRIRWIAKELGIERVSLKKNKLQCYFLSNPQSGFYETDRFQKILNYVAQSNAALSLKQSNQTLIMIAQNIPDLQSARNQLAKIKTYAT